MWLAHGYLKDEFLQEILNSELFDKWLIRFGVEGTNEFLELSYNQQLVCLSEFLDYYHWFKSY